MHRPAPALLLLLAACSRLGFTLPPDARPSDTASTDVSLPDGPADRAQLDSPVHDGATLDTPSPDTSAKPLAGSLQHAGTGPVFRLLLGMADNDWQTPPPAYVKELELDATASTLLDTGFVAASPGSLKALDLDAQGRLLLASYGAPSTLEQVETSPALKLAGSISLSHAKDPGRAVRYPHALCFLPGGNFLVADGANADNNCFNEYDPAGNLVRAVHTSKLAPSGAGSVISVCISRTDLEIIAHESAINAYYGRLLRFTRPSAVAAWTLTDTVEVADVAAKLGLATTGTWSFALDQKNDQIYVAPFYPSSGTINRLIRCPATGFNATTCVLAGDVLPGATTTGGSAIKSMVQIPGTDDLLAVSHGNDTATAARRIYRYSVASGTWTALFDLRQISGGYAEPQGYPLLL